MQRWSNLLDNEVSLVDDKNGRGTDHRSMREANRFLVLNYIREQKTLPRSELTRYTGLSRTTIGTIVGELIEAGLVQQEDPQHGKDRRTNILSFNVNAGCVLGGTLGRGHLTLLLADLAGTPLQYVHLPFAAEEGPEKGLLLLVTRIRAFAEQHVAWDKIVGLGLGIVGPLDPSLQKTTPSTLFRGWAGVNIQQALIHSLGIPVFLDNNGNMGALGESTYGAGRDERHMIYLKVGSGIAGGLILNHQLYRGENGTAGEIGHIPIDFNGSLCHCGRSGCLETVAGRAGILMEARRLNPTITSMKQAIAAAREGDPGCIHALTRAGKYLGFVLAMLVNSLNPSLIVLDGSTMQANTMTLQSLLSTLEVHCIPSLFASTRVMVSEQHGLAMARGGVATVLTAVFGA